MTEYRRCCVRDCEAPAYNDYRRSLQFCRQHGIEAMQSLALGDIPESTARMLASRGVPVPPSPQEIAEEAARSQREAAAAAACMAVDMDSFGNANELPMVYFVRFPGLGFIKIGTTTNLKKRLDALRTSVPDGDLEVLLLLPGSYDLERSMHRQFRHLRVRGEWFRADDELLDFIDERRPKNMQIKEQG